MVFLSLSKHTFDPGQFICAHKNSEAIILITQFNAFIGFIRIRCFAQ